MVYITTFTNNLLPILLLAAAGFLLGKFLSVDPRPLGRVIFYIFSPLLVFNLLTQTELPVERMLVMIGYAISVMLVIGGIALLLGLLFRLPRPVLLAVVLTAMIGNNGNYGLPLIGFAFGQEAQAYASIYFVTSSMTAYTIGVLIASLGHMNLKQALLGLVKVPAVYAILLAVVFIQTGWTLPDPIQRTVALGAGGAVPAMLVLLGLELSRVEWSRNIRALGIPAFVRLVIGPLIGFALAAAFGLKGAPRQAGITESGMPSAVTTTMIAAEYNLEPALVTAIVFINTILSPLTLTPLLVFLGK
jgi:predicted permease